MDNIYTDDAQRISELFGISEEELCEKLVSVAPMLDADTLRLIKSYYKKGNELPTVGELRICERLLCRRREYADSVSISRLGCDSLALIETYSDLLSKAEALNGKAAEGLTVEKAAHISGDYLRMIGRYDSRPLFSAGGAENDADALTVLDGEKVVFSVGAKKKKKKAAAAIKENYSVVLLDGDRPEAELGRLLADKEARAVCRMARRIGEFGIIGALCGDMNGVRIDTRRISSEKTDAEVLCDGYIGKLLVFISLGKAADFCARAEKKGIHAVYFANTDNKGLMVTRDNKVSMELLRKMIENRVARPVLVAENDLSASCARVGFTAKKNKKSYDLSGDKLIKSHGRIIAAYGISSEKNSFGEAVNSVTDNVLRLVSTGIDRRAICSAVFYEFEKKNTDAQKLGEELSLVLGIYRACIELALSEGRTSVCYGEECSASVALYSTAPRHPVSMSFTEAGSYVGFLPMEIGSDGLVDFASLRRICDEFISICKKGEVLSARAVTECPRNTLSKMSGTLCARLDEKGKVLEDISCKGIVFETREKDSSGIIGRVAFTAENRPENEQNDANC